MFRPCFLHRKGHIARRLSPKSSRRSHHWLERPFHQALFPLGMCLSDKPAWNYYRRYYQSTRTRQPFVPQHLFNGIIYFVVVLLPTETGFKCYKNDHWLKCGSLSSSFAPKFRRIALWHFQTSCLSSRREVIKSLVWGEGWDHFKNCLLGFQIRSVLRIRVAQIC